VSKQPDYNSDQLFKSNLTFCVFMFFDLQFKKLVFLTRVVHSQSTLQRQIKKKKKHPLLFNKLLNLIPVEPFFLPKCIIYGNIKKVYI
jgi:hypothetical protein